LDSLPLHGSNSRAKQTDASKAAAQLKKAEKAQKVAEAAAKKTELLSKVKDFKAEKPIAAPTLSPVPYVSTPRIAGQVAEGLHRRLPLSPCPTADVGSQ
jgi:hypothetical protein